MHMNVVRIVYNLKELIFKEIMFERKNIKCQVKKKKTEKDHIYLPFKE